MPEMVRLDTVQALLDTLTPIPQGQPIPALWEVAFALEVSRSALRSQLGEPFYVETDGGSTFGGEEDGGPTGPPQTRSSRFVFECPTSMLCST